MKKRLLVLLICSLVSIIFTPKNSFAAKCAEGGNGGSPILEVPTYDYGEDNLVRFHFKVDPSGWATTNFYQFRYNAECEFLGSYTYTFDGSARIPPGINKLMLKAHKNNETGPYNFIAYNEDTGEEVNIGPGPGVFSNPIVAVGFLQIYWFGTYGALSPAVSVENPDPVINKTPLLIVPGILGTELYNEENLIWPNLEELVGLEDYFLTENLGLDENGKSIKEIKTGEVISKIELPVLPDIDLFENLKNQLFENNDYEPNKTLFFFPYDWRLGLEETRENLKNKIEEIKNQTGSEKVDIIAHSMGGLLTKNYIKSYGKNSINKLFFVGTPHLGAPKAAKVLIEGDKFGNPFLEPDRMKELAKNSGAIYQLLPNQTYFNNFVGYLKKTKPSILSPEPAVMDYSQSKDFLINEINLNSGLFNKAEDFFAGNLENLDLSGIESYNIIGCKAATFAGFNLYKDNSIGSIKWTSGDGTVPLVSSEYSLNAKNYYLKNVNHSTMPSADGVVEVLSDLLNNQTPALNNSLSEDSSFCNFKGKETVWKSPVAVHIYDEQGRHTGPLLNGEIENSIPGVYYDIIKGEKFVFLPTDQNQKYQIIGEGESLGSFDLQISNIENGEVLSTKVFNDVAISTATPISFNLWDTSTDSEIKVNNELLLVSSILTAEQARDLTPPETSLLIEGEKGENGWYKSNVKIVLNSQDGNSGILETKYSLDGGNNFLTYIAPVNIMEAGDIKLEYYSTDRAGNREEKKNTLINIDKTPPEFQVAYSLEKNDFIFTASEMGQNIVVTCTSSTCLALDPAGNNSIISFKKTSLLSIKTLELKQIEKNKDIAKFEKNVFVVGNFSLNNVLKDFNQTVLINNQEVARIDYVKSKNLSYIVEFTKQGLKKYTLPGINYIKLFTLNNSLKAEIK